jgi:hypothetical protein
MIGRAMISQRLSDIVPNRMLLDFKTKDNNHKQTSNVD